MQAELAVHCPDFGGPDQARMRDRHRMERAFQLLQPERQKSVENGKSRTEIVVLPNKCLQHRRMIRKPIENLRRGQAIALELASKVFACHVMPSDSDTKSC